MKKGFTLIELIVVVGLIGIIGLIITANLTGAFSNQQDEQYAFFEETLENAACTYIDRREAELKKADCLEKKSCTVNLQTLLKFGLIVDSDLVNPKTGSKVSTSTNSVTIVYDSEGVKKCCYNEEDKCCLDETAPGCSEE